MVRWRRAGACERAAEWISLQLDDELSEFECAALERHVARCESCAAARASVAAFTAVLRETPTLTRAEPVVVPVTRAPRRARLVRAGAASLVLAGALAAAALVALPRGAPIGSSAALAFATPKERLQFAAAEHARIDVRVPAAAVLPVKPSPFAARVLF
jgi:anti-sigma factor RsiW